MIIANGEVINSEDKVIKKIHIAALTEKELTHIKGTKEKEVNKEYTIVWS